MTKTAYIIFFMLVVGCKNQQPFFDPKLAEDVILGSNLWNNDQVDSINFHESWYVNRKKVLDLIVDYNNRQGLKTSDSSLILIDKKNYYLVQIGYTTYSNVSASPTLDSTFVHEESFDSVVFLLNLDYSPIFSFGQMYKRNELINFCR